MTALENFCNIPGLQHLAEKIFNNLDPKSITYCRSVSSALMNFIDNCKPLISEQITDLMIFRTKTIGRLIRSREILFSEKDWKNLLDSSKSFLTQFEYFSVEDLQKVLIFMKNVWSKPTKCDKEHLQPTSDCKKMTLFSYACFHNFHEIVELLIKNQTVKKSDLNVTDNDNMTPLHYACQNGSLEIVETLLNCQFSYQIKFLAVCIRGNSPLHYACSFGHIKIVQLLLNHNESNLFLNYQSRVGHYTPVNYACLGGHVEIIETLLDHSYPSGHRIDLNLPDQFGWTPLHYACSKGYFKIVQKMLKFNNLSINARNDQGQTPLHLACSTYNGAQIVQILLKHKKINKEIRDENQRTAYGCAIKHGYFHITKVF